jgi:hypothetical protein
MTTNDSEHDRGTDQAALEEIDAALMRSLAALPRHDIDAARAERLGRAARDVFLREHHRAQSDAWARLGAVYHRALEPAMMVALCTVHLGWALSTVAQIL